jgi:hypothetical protein
LLLLVLAVVEVELAVVVAVELVESSLIFLD